MLVLAQILRPAYALGARFLFLAFSLAFPLVLFGFFFRSFLFLLGSFLGSLFFDYAVALCLGCTKYSHSMTNVLKIKKKRA